MLPMLLSPLIVLGDARPAPFQPVQVPLSEQASDVRVLACDLDGDAAEEVLISGALDELVVVREDAHGALHLRRLPLPWTARDVAVDDLDGDGDADVALSSGAALTLLENLGGGAFAPPMTIAASLCRTVEVADFDGDGRPDLLSSTFKTLRPFRNLGGLQFEALPTQEALPSSGRFAPGDWNGDGHVDLVGVGHSELRVLIGDGSGAFAALPYQVIGPFTKDVRVADLDADGALDLMLLESFAASPYLRGAGDGTFVAAAELLAPTTFVRDACVADFDLDGRPDALLAASLRPLVDRDPLTPGRVVALQRTPWVAAAVARLRAGQAARVVGVTWSDPASEDALAWSVVRFVPGEDLSPEGLFERAPLDANLSGVVVDADFDNDGRLDRVYDAGQYGPNPLALLRGSAQAGMRPPGTWASRPSSRAPATSTGTGTPTWSARRRTRVPGACASATAAAPSPRPRPSRRVCPSRASRSPSGRSCPISTATVAATWPWSSRESSRSRRARATARSCPR